MRPGGWRTLRHILHDVIDWLFDYNLPVDPPPAPRGRPVLLSHRQIFTGAPDTMSRFGYTFTTPALDRPEDVAQLRLFSTVDGADQPPVDLAPGDRHELIFDLDQQISVRFKTVDAAGNPSVDFGPAYEFTVVDDVPPAAPTGAPVLVDHRQLFDATETPTDPTEPTGPTEPEPEPTEPTEPVAAG